MQKEPVTESVLLNRWEAHIWVKELGRQVYLGGYEHEEHAAEAYDVAALKCKGFRVKTNFDADRSGVCSTLHGCAFIIDSHSSCLHSWLSDGR